MTNRFLEMGRHFTKVAGKPCRSSATGMRTATGTGDARRKTASSMSYAKPFAAANRALVILIENGGVDLGIPTLVEKILSVIPGSNLIPDSSKTELVDHIRDKIKNFTDQLIETAEL